MLNCVPLELDCALYSNDQKFKLQCKLDLDAQLFVRHQPMKGWKYLQTLFVLSFVLFADDTFQTPHVSVF